MSKLDEIIAEFQDLDLQERLELLLEFASGLPELPDRFQALRDAGLDRVVECQTPVFLWVELDSGRVRVFADVAPEAPTVKGFVAILVEAFDGAAPETVLATPGDLLKRMGLADALGMTRLRGLHAVVSWIKRLVVQSLSTAAELK